MPTPFTYFMTTMPQIPRNRHTHTPYFFAKAVSVIQKITTIIPRHSPAFYAKIAKGERRDKRKIHFRFDYAEPHPIFILTKITNQLCNIGNTADKKIKQIPYKTYSNPGNSPDELIKHKL